MHLVSATLVDVQFRDLILILHFQHVFHCRFPGISNTLLIWRTNQTHIKTGAAAHWRDIDNLYTITVKMVTHKTSKQVLQGMDPSFWHHFFVRHAEAQIEHGDCVAMRGVHCFRHPNCRRFHPGMIDCEAI